jgi:hypothetical protein
MCIPEQAEALRMTCQSHQTFVDDSSATSLSWNLMFFMCKRKFAVIAVLLTNIRVFNYLLL